MNACVFHRPLIPLTIAYMLGIAMGETLPGYKAPMALAALAGVVALVFCIYKRQSNRPGPLVFFFAAGYLAIAPFLSPEFSLNHVIHFTDKGPVKLAGVVDDTPHVVKGRMKFPMAVEQVWIKGEKIDATGKIRVTIAGNINIRKKDRLSFTAKIRSIRNFNNPGRFDYVRYMRFQKIFGSSYVKADRVTLTPTARFAGMMCAVDGLRNFISGQIDKADLFRAGSKAGSTDQKAVLKALLIGEKKALSPDLREAFNRAGLGHLLAISGLHVGIVAGVAFMAFNWIFSFIPLFLKHGWSKKAAAIATLFPVMMYGLLAGMSPSTQRAVIMVSVFLIAYPIQREHDPLNTLSIAALVILVLFPQSLFSVSFQLSFTAVLGIIIGFMMLPKKDPENQKIGYGVYLKVGNFVYISLFAFISTLPVIMMYFNQVPFLGLIANLVVVPVIGFVAVPVGLFALLLMVITTKGAFLMLGAAGFLIGLGLDVVYFISGLFFAAAKTITPSLFEILLFYLFLGMLTGIKKYRYAKYGAAVLVVIALFDAAYWADRRLFNENLKVTAIDVGQGGSALIEMPGGYTALYDGGGFYDNTVFDVGKRVVAPFLWQRKIATIDLLILSHPNADHLNGLIYIARHFHVKTLWSNNETSKTKGYAELMRVCREQGVRIADFETLEKEQTIHDVVLKIIYPPSGFLTMKSAQPWRDANNNSMVIKAVFGKTSFLFTGDIMAPSENELVERSGKDLKSTILFAPHHGSARSNSPVLVNAVKPGAVIFSAGYMNRFNFPRPEVVGRYQKAGAALFNTSAHGAVRISSDGKSLEIKPYLGSDARILNLLSYRGRW